MPRKRWIKLWTQEAIAGTTRREMEPDERSVWWDFLALAGDSLEPGKICFYSGVPLTDDQLIKALNITQELLDRARSKMLKHEKISIDNGIIHITNWEHYQGEYERIKAWRREQRKAVIGSVSSETGNNSLQMKQEMLRGDQNRGRPEEDKTRTEEEKEEYPSSSSAELIASKMLSNYEQEIDKLTPKVANQIKDYASVFVSSQAPIGWVDEAFKEAATNNKRSWAYVKEILETWIRHGKGGISADSDKYSRGKYGPLVKR